MGFMENTMSTGKAAKLLGVTAKTLQRWEREGRLIPAARTGTNRRLYTESQIREFIGLRRLGAVPTRLVAYCRVSSAAQKPDLANQRRVLEEFVVARGLANVEFIEEVGGGLNFKRKRFLALMDEIGRGEIKTLILAHRDRLTRFGFEWFEHYAKTHGCEILVLNQERLSPEQEMVQDLMTIVHCFSSRLHGLRNYRKKLDELLKQDVAHDAQNQDRHPSADE
ncbi:MAG: putative resolvase [Tepidiphilus sp.]|jgi:putative resolvase|uniref:Predicted site-specific integrase-resolvase n=2 Tax=Hydrogenophilaceae TaxID=206349 RepID=A0A0K6IXK3_9PROT|nr:putative resolvase [Tepidiphilus sp.]CUB07779.1 Predicted site-specific integrase-resolvase [Tepidiphilus thermophilus]